TIRGRAEGPSVSKSEPLSIPSKASLTLGLLHESRQAFARWPHAIGGDSLASGRRLASARQPTDAGQAQKIVNWQQVAGCEAEVARYFPALNPIVQGAELDRTGRYLKRRQPDATSCLPGSAGISPIMGHVDGRASAPEALRSLPGVTSRPAIDREILIRAVLGSQANIRSTTCPETSVRRKSRPMWR
ncbi:MAG: hypothetical protein OXJ37_20525, partial [Bryobacterales bacterium]|nr:hypothetical protein [Bryobacterales bacterium]